MKKFVNKTKQQKRVVVYEGNGKKETKTYFLRRGQAITTSEIIKHAEEGIKEVDVKKASNKATVDNKEKTEDKEQ